MRGRRRTPPHRAARGPAPGRVAAKWAGAEPAGTFRAVAAAGAMDLVGLFSKTTGALLGKKTGGFVRVDTTTMRNLEEVAPPPPRPRLALTRPAANQKVHRPL